jgi:hypothetical protein
MMLTSDKENYVAEFTQPQAKAIMQKAYCTYAIPKETEKDMPSYFSERVSDVV